MVRTQIQLEEVQYKRLKVLAARRSKSISQIIRESVEHVLAAAPREDAWRRMLEAAGTCHTESEPQDVSTRHDIFLALAHAADE